VRGREKGRDSEAEGSRPRSRGDSLLFNFVDGFLFDIFLLCVCDDMSTVQTTLDRVTQIADDYGYVARFGRPVIFLTIRNRVFIVTIDGACTRPRHLTKTMIKCCTCAGLADEFQRVPFQIRSRYGRHDDIQLVFDHWRRWWNCKSKKMERQYFVSISLQAADAPEESTL
jgi:hypothetical protein